MSNEYIFFTDQTALTFRICLVITVCSQIHTKHINTLCGQKVEFFNVKLVVHIVTTGLQKVKSL